MEDHDGNNLMRTQPNEPEGNFPVRSPKSVDAPQIRRLTPIISQLLGITPAWLLTAGVMMKRTILIALTPWGIPSALLPDSDPLVLGGAEISADSINQQGASTTFSGRVSIKLGDTEIRLDGATMTEVEGKTIIDGTKEGGGLTTQ